MKTKWTPNILIWDLMLMPEGGEFVIQHLYFLSRKRMEKWIKKNEEELRRENINWCAGGEQLWLW